MRWGGEEVSSLSEARRDRWRRDKLGLVFQDFQLVSGLNILENVLLPATFRFQRVPPLLLARARVLLEEMGLERPLLSVDRLSRGEMQRAAIARALLFDPLILLADEPTASLDRDNARTVLRLLTEHARRRGRTLLLVTHAPPAASAEEGVDRVLRLEQGRLEEEGDEA